jgi:2-polyprenyl-3-methyl-5-hydroxy-6-metoxy-1,4-benzoquinol methylase
MDDHAAVVEANRRYHDAHITVYEEITHVAFPHYARRVQSHLNRIQQFLPRPAEECTALDAGAGTGYFTKFLLERGFNVKAIEVSAAMRSQLAQRFPDAAQLEIINSDIAEYLAETPEQVDVISFVSVLHHIYDYQKVLSLAASKLAPGGVLYSTCDPIPSQRPAASKAVHQIDKLAYALGHPSAITRRLTRSAAPLSESDGSMELAEYHAMRNGLNLDAIRQVLSSAGLVPVAIERGTSSRVGPLRTIEGWLGAGTDLFMLWQRPL